MHFTSFKFLSDGIFFIISSFKTTIKDIFSLIKINPKIEIYILEV